MKANFNNTRLMGAVTCLAVITAAVTPTAWGQDTHNYDVTFTTSNQHKWLAPNVAATAGETELFGGSFDVSAGEISLPSLNLPVIDQLGDIPDIFEVVDTCFLFVDVDACGSCVGDCVEEFFDTVGCNIGCVDECIPCAVGQCDACNACIDACNDQAFADCENSCSECEATEICLADLMGAEITDISLAAGFHMFFNYGPLTATDNNYVNVSYPASIDIQSPTADTFTPGDTVTISTSWAPNTGATMTTTSPTDPIVLRNEMYFDANIEFDLCGPEDGDCSVEDNSSLSAISDLFDFISFGSAEEPLGGELLTLTAEGESICDLDPSAILCYLGVSGDLGIPNITTSTTGNGSACMQSDEVTDRFVDITLDIDTWIAAYLCPPCKKAIPAPFTGFFFGFGPVSIGAFTIGVQLWDWDMGFVFDQTESFSFCGDDVAMTLDLGGTAVDYTVRDSANVVQTSGTASTINLYAGDSVDITVPNEVLTVTPDFGLLNTYSPSGDVEFKLNMDMEFLSLTLAIPSFTIICNPFDTDECLDFPYTDLGTLGPVVRIASEDEPSDSPVIEATFGNLAVADLGLFNQVVPFQLEGFNNPVGASFSVDPQQPPVIAADEATVTVNENDVATLTGSFSDAEGGPLMLTASIGSVLDNNDGTWSWFYQTLDGPADGQTVTITVDDGELMADVMFELIVNNIDPVAAIDSVQDETGLALNYVDRNSAEVSGDLATVFTNLDVVLNASYSDVGSLDTHTATIDWGDGTVDTPVRGQRLWSAGGSHRILAGVTRVRCSGDLHDCDDIYRQ